MTQMAALSFALEPAQHTSRFVARGAFQVPPIQQLAIPMQQAFLAGVFHAGHESHWGGCNRGRGRGGQGCTPFADYMPTAGAAAATPDQIVPFGGGNTQLLLVQRALQQKQNPNFSNIYNRYNN
jgi:hypothetical protein